MPDTIDTPALPVETASPTPPHDETGTSAAVAATPLGEKIASAASAVAEKFGLQFKRGRGRPRKDGTPKASDTLVNPATGQAVPAASQPALSVAVQADNPPPAETAMLHRAIIGGAKGVLGAAHEFTRQRALEAGLDRPFVERACAETKPDPEALADFSESLAAVLQKYNVSTAYAPEAVLLISTARLGTPYFLLHRALSQEIARKRATEEAAKKGGVQ